MDDYDPISQFFPGQEDVNLYAVLSLERDASLDAIKKSYRRLALVYHPDKHTTANDQAKEDASTKFQQIGFAYAVLSDAKKRARYDTTGRTDEGLDFDVGGGGWESYFEELFDRVTRSKLDEMKKEYQGSPEELEDLKAAYKTTGGSLEEMMTYIPHSTHEDEARFIAIITDWIKNGTLDATPGWLSSSRDKKAKMRRKKASEKEAKEAETLAKDLGVWDEFYGSGQATDKKSKGEAKGREAEMEGEDDHSVLQALILKKREKNTADFFDNLAAKYSESSSKTRSRGKGKKRDHDPDEEESLKKKSRSSPPPPPDLNDEEFAKLQEKLFGNKAKTAAGPSASKKKGKGSKVK